MTTVSKPCEDALDTFLRSNPDLKPYVVIAHSLSWGAILSERAWNQSIDRAFSRRSVQRDSESPIDLHIDDHYWVLKGIENLTKPFGVTDVLVRNEYLTVAADIIRFVSSGSAEFLDNTNSPGNADPHAMDQDDLAQPNSLPFKNPFDQPVPSVKGRDVILTGSPGVGKTLFLYVLLAFRLAAGLTTLFHHKPGKILLFSVAGVFEITTQAFSDVQIDILTDIFPSAWCLVDSNRLVTDIPEFILRTRLPIIQAASPRQNRFDWLKKRNNVNSLMYYMKPWSLDELIIGRDLQEKRISEQALQYWHEHYAPLARVAYNRADRPNDYEKALKLKLSHVDAASIDSLLSRAILSEPNVQISHEIVVFTPKPDRSNAFCHIPTLHLWDLVMEGIATSTRIGIVEAFRQFSSSSYLRGAAGSLLENIVLRHLMVNGGHPITAMSAAMKDKWIHWKPQSNAVSEWLSIGHSDNTKITVEVAKPKNPFTPAGFYLYDSELSSLEDGYLYIPKASNQPTLDAFFYNQKVAIVYQITLANDHSVSSKGLEFLKKFDVEEVYFVGVTPDHDTLFKISPTTVKKYDHMLKHPYHYHYIV